MPFPIERIYIEAEAEKDRLTQTVLENLSHLPVERISDKKPFIKQALSNQDPIGEGKKNLLITRFYGRRLKSCPGTSHHICCGYHVINAVTNCPMDCSYCVLQGYLNNPFLTLYSNWDDLLHELDLFLSAHPQSLLRLGTGELSDSLALDSIVPLSELLVPYFAEKDNALLELKTKSCEIDRLLSLDHRGRTVVSWSLTPPEVIRNEEKRTALLEDRIKAARRCQESGYLLGFHFDPLIQYPGWEKGYREAIQSLFRRIDPKRIAWISLGGFRYPQQLKAISQERFPQTKIFLGEIFPGRDAKFRYLQEIRVEMYRAMKEWLKEVDPDLFIYLCMESKEVWNEVFGWSPVNSSHLNRMFEERMRSGIR